MLEEREEWAKQWDKKTPNFIDLAKLIDLENYGHYFKPLQYDHVASENIMWSLATNELTKFTHHSSNNNKPVGEGGFQPICDGANPQTLIQPASVYSGPEQIGDSAQYHSTEPPLGKVIYWTNSIQ